MTISSDFPIVDRASWLVAAKKALKGASVDQALVSLTLDDIAIPALATAEDLTSLPRPAASGNAGWLVAQSPTHPMALEASGEILGDLEGGAGAFRLPVDNRSWQSENSFGMKGVFLPDYKALEDVLQSIHLDYVTSQLSPGAAFYPFSAWFLAYGAGVEGLKGSLGADPLATLALEGALPTSIDDGLGQLARIANHLDGDYPELRACQISSLVYHGAGASEAQELAILLATALEYMRAMEKSGLKPVEAAAQINFALAAGPDLFLGMAKIRALRILWSHLLRESGIHNPNPAPVHAEVAPRIYTRQDVWNNLLRATTAAMGAAIGGADSIGIAAHTSALGLPRPNARRVARNIQMLLREEAQLGAVEDAAGGAYALEKLTRDLAQKAWEIFQDIDSEGGMGLALIAGSVQGMIAKSRTKLLAAIGEGERQIIGVTAYPPSDERPENLRKSPSFKGQDGKTLDVDMSDFDGLIASASTLSLADMMATLAGEGVKVEPLHQIRLSEAYEGTVAG